MGNLRKNGWKIMALLIAAGAGLTAASFEDAIGGRKCIEQILQSWNFIGFSGLILFVSLRTALNRKIKTSFFIWLLVTGFFIGTVTQLIGTTNHLWRFQESFLFAGFFWAIAAPAMLGLSFFLRKKILREAVVDKVPATLKWKNVAILLLVAIPLFLEGLKTDVRLNFAIYYFSLLAFALMRTSRLRFRALFSFIAAAWVTGFISEYMGAHIGLWQFETVDAFGFWSSKYGWPPPYLIIGCWPLEFLAELSLSAYISQQDIYLLLNAAHFASRDAAGST